MIEMSASEDDDEEMRLEIAMIKELLAAKDTQI